MKIPKVMLMFILTYGPMEWSGLWEVGFAGRIVSQMSSKRGREQLNNRDRDIFERGLHRKWREKKGTDSRIRVLGILLEATKLWFPYGRLKRSVTNCQVNKHKDG